MLLLNIYLLSSVFLHLCIVKNHIDQYSHLVILVGMLIIVALLNTCNQDAIPHITSQIDGFLFEKRNMLDEFIELVQKDYKRSSTRRLINYFLSSIQKRECPQSIK